MTGCCWACAATTLALIYSNWALRLGCLEPSSALRLNWRENPSLTNFVRTVSALIGCPIAVRVAASFSMHDFEDKKLGKVVPYGVYDMTANAGFVSVGITSDTAEFAVQSIRCWREGMGRQRYPHARELTITADCGGSNGARVRLWKVELQKIGRRDRPRDPRPPLSAGHIKVEQDRAPAVLPHHAELARPAAHRSACGGRVDRRDHDR